MLVTASCFEIVVLAVVITARSYALKFLALLWLSAIFAVYRKLISQFNLQCNCAGVISPSSFFTSESLHSVFLIALCSISFCGICVLFLQRLKAISS